MTRVLHITDLHVVPPPARVSGRLDTGRLLVDAIDRLLAAMPRFAPLDAVLVTGDIADDGRPESYVFVRSQLERLGLPILVLPGNHDRREPLRKMFGDLACMPAHGPIDWCVDLGGLRVIGLDTAVEGADGGALAPRSIAHLSTALAGAGDRPVLVALHHPPFETGIRFMDEIGLREPGALASALAGATPRTRLVCGHVHAAITGSVGGVTAVVAPSLCSAIALDLRGDAPQGYMLGPRGYMIHDWRGGGFCSTAQWIVDEDGPHPF